jgi:hypothetical protein
MPDWFAHIMLATIVSTGLRLTREKRVLFFIGNVMPDLVRFLVIIPRLLNIDDDAFSAMISSPINTSSHSLLGVIAYALLISIFFEPSLSAIMASPIQSGAMEGNALKSFLAKWKSASSSPLFLLVLGGITHLFLDTFMWPMGGGILWLYPLNQAAFRWTFGAWWPSTFDGIVVLAPFFAAALVAELALALWKKKRA